MRILAIDPGPTLSGYYGGPHCHGVVENHGILDVIEGMSGVVDLVAIESMEARGMPLGNESLETVLWTGRFVQACYERGVATGLFRRSAIKLTLCGSNRAKDANVRAALIDIYGAPGKKKTPGGTYGVKSHAWAALAVWHCARLANAEVVG